MLVFQLYNSLTKKLETFETLEPGKVKLYNCGPTVYKRPHLGNMRRFLFADFLRRTLELAGYEVRDITNITDVGHLTQDELDTGEDKLERAAREEKVSPQAIAEAVTQQYFNDIAALNIQPAHKYPRATAHIPEMQEVIEQLINRGHAYVAADGVYFDVQSFPDYGKLSGNTLDTIKAGARVEVREEKKHPADFALWKMNDPTHLQQWDSPWGRGYPGWHIECSAMSMKYLGPQLDIHTGGEDNKFPHHENEIAQSEGATGLPFSRFWLHNGFLQLSGTKLAKREGEQLTIDSLVERGYSPLAFRLLAFGSHYRSPMDFSWEAMDAASENLKMFKQFIRRLSELSPPTSSAGRPAGGEVPASAGVGVGDVDEGVVNKFMTALADDLNTPEALAVVFDYVRESNKKLEGASLSPTEADAIWATLLKFDTVLGLLAILHDEIAAETIPDDIKKLAAEREQARQNKQFERSDELRLKIEALGYSVEDTPTGPRLVLAK